MQSTQLHLLTLYNSEYKMQVSVFLAICKTCCPFCSVPAKVSALCISFNTILQSSRYIGIRFDEKPQKYHNILSNHTFALTFVNYLIVFFNFLCYNIITIFACHNFTKTAEWLTGNTPKLIRNTSHLLYYMSIPCLQMYRLIKNVLIYCF